MQYAMNFVYITILFRISLDQLSKLQDTILHICYTHFQILDMACNCIPNIAPFV